MSNPKIDHTKNIAHSLPKNESPKKGYTTLNKQSLPFSRLGSIIHYDSTSNVVAIQWLDDNRVDYNIPIANNSSKDSYFGAAPEIGDLALCVSVADGRDSSRYFVVGYYTLNFDKNRMSSINYNFNEGNYNFNYSRSAEPGDVYLRSSRGGEVLVDSDLFLTNSGLTTIEAKESSDLLSFYSKGFDFFGPGTYFNFGPAYRDMAYFDDSSDEGSFKAYHKTRFDHKASSSLDSKITPQLLSDTNYLYSIFPEDSYKDEKSTDEVKPFTEFRLTLKETSSWLPEKTGASDLMNLSHNKPVDSKGNGHFIDFGVGTKIGGNPDSKKLFARPNRRFIFSDLDTFDKLTKPDEILTPITKNKDSSGSHGISYWLNLYDKENGELPIALSEVSRSGSLKFLYSGKAERSKEDIEDKNLVLDNSIEGATLGRVKLRIGKQDKADDAEEYNEKISTKDASLKSEEEDKTVAGIRILKKEEGFGGDDDKPGKKDRYPFFYPDLEDTSSGSDLKNESANSASQEDLNKDKSSDEVSKDQATQSNIQGNTSGSKTSGVIFKDNIITISGVNGPYLDENGNPMQTNLEGNPSVEDYISENPGSVVDISSGEIKDLNKLFNDSPKFISRDSVLTSFNSTNGSIKDFTYSGQSNFPTSSRVSDFNSNYSSFTNATPITSGQSLDPSSFMSSIGGDEFSKLISLAYLTDTDIAKDINNAFSFDDLNYVDRLLTVEDVANVSNIYTLAIEGIIKDLSPGGRFNLQSGVIDQLNSVTSLTDTDIEYLSVAGLGLDLVEYTLPKSASDILTLTTNKVWVILYNMRY